MIVVADVPAVTAAFDQLSAALAEVDPVQAAAVERAVVGLFTVIAAVGLPLLSFERQRRP